MWSVKSGRNLHITAVDYLLPSKCVTNEKVLLERPEKTRAKSVHGSTPSVMVSLSLIGWSCLLQSGREKSLVFWHDSFIN